MLRCRSTDVPEPLAPGVVSPEICDRSTKAHTGSTRLHQPKTHDFYFITLRVSRETPPRKNRADERLTEYSHRPGSKCESVLTVVVEQYSYCCCRSITSGTPHAGNQRMCMMCRAICTGRAKKKKKILKAVLRAVRNWHSAWFDFLTHSCANLHKERHQSTHVFFFL